MADATWLDRARSADPDDLPCAALAHFALDGAMFAREHGDSDEAIRSAFDLLERGWEGARKLGVSFGLMGARATG